MKRRNLNDIVWWAIYENRNVKKPCPVCCGKLNVKIICGNDDEYELPCQFCSPGYQEPSGYITEYEFVSIVKQVQITHVERFEKQDGEISEYHHGHYILRDENIFDTKEDAEERCKELIKQRLIEEETRTENIKKNQLKSYSWNAGYHVRAANKARKDAEYHDRKAVLCKQKSKRGTDAEP